MNLVVTGVRILYVWINSLRHELKIFRRNKVQQAIEGGRVLVNNKTASANYKIRPGDSIVCFSDKQSVGEEIIPEKMAVEYFL